MSDYVKQLEEQNEQLKQQLAVAEERLSHATYGEWLPVSNGKDEVELYHYKVRGIHLATVHMVHNNNKQWAGYVIYMNNENLYAYGSLQVALRETEKRLFVVIAEEFKETGKKRRYSYDGRTWQ